MRLSIEGFKSIADKQHIDINGLTVIAGVNSSGKSSFMQPLLILKQTFEENTNGKNLVIHGENVNFTQHSQILSQFPDDIFETFTVSIEFKNDAMHSISNDTTKVIIRFDEKKGFIVEESILNPNSNSEIRLTNKISFEELHQQAVKLLERNLHSKTYGQFLKTVLQSATAENNILALEIDKSLLVLNINDPQDFSLTTESSHSPKLVNLQFSPNAGLRNVAENIIHIPGIRFIPARTYPYQRYSIKFQGRFDKYVASIIYDWAQNEPDKLAELISILQEIGLATEIKPVKITDAEIAINVLTTGNDQDSNYQTKHFVNISDVGLGVSQVLPILVSLILANQEHIIYIEQPEIHLHPKAQYQLAKVICRYANHHKKIILETHSSIFIRALQIEVAEGALKPSLFSLNWFSQDKNGKTNVTQANLDEMGSYGEWPIDFDEVYLSIEDRYLTAVEKHLSQN